MKTLVEMLLHDLGQTISLVFVLALALGLYYTTGRR